MGYGGVKLLKSLDHLRRAVDMPVTESAFEHTRPTWPCDSVGGQVGGFRYHQRI